MKLNRRNTAKSQKGKTSGDLARDLAEHAPTTPPRRNAPGVPEFPHIGPGEWIDILQQREPHVTVELSMGAFVWLWDVLELRVMKYEQGVQHGLTPEYREVYEGTVFGCLDEVRHAASRHFRIIESKEPTKTTAKASVIETAAKGKPDVTTPTPKPKTKKKKRLRFNTS